LNITIIGSGRAGSSFAAALRDAHHHVDVRHHGELIVDGPVDLVLLCVPDDALVPVATELTVPPFTVVAHCAGSRTLDVLAPHERVGSLHPLVALSNATVGAERLRGATYCVAGDELVSELVHSLDGRTIVLADEQRAAYHAAACVAANHVVALLGHAERLAAAAGLELADFLPLTQNAIDDVVREGPARALTGPASRGDLVTIDAHLAAMDDEERATYVALANAALVLAERRTSTASH
jgi:predicted short-subunit dehydrogenase-like oxidoreductase (DUF2520 family)